MQAPVPKLQGENRVHNGLASTSVATLVDALSPQLTVVGNDGPLVLFGSSSVELIAAAGWLATTGADGMIVPADRMETALRDRLAPRGCAFVDLDRKRVAAPIARAIPVLGRVMLLTSGTTGDPKLFEHSWKTLFTMSRVSRPRAENWLLTYQPGTYAWWQMVTMLLFLPGQSLTVADELTPVCLAETAMAHGVTAISATPTFWRMVLLQFASANLQRLPLRQITLGGEPVDQRILDQLGALFPGARLTHIYASSEAGTAIVVGDGREGFPADWLDAGDDRPIGAVPRLCIRDGILWIRSPFATQSGWVCSGDLCEVRSGRVVILGREHDGFINVGGAKVAAHEVERVLRSHRAVLWCRVARRKAPFLGELVAADVVLQPSAAGTRPEDLMRFCSDHLAPHMVPRFVNILADIPVTPNLKSQTH